MRVLRETKFLPELRIDPGKSRPKPSLLSTRLSLHPQLLIKRNIICEYDRKDIQFQIPWARVI